MKICDKCGAQNEDSTKFCTSCGTQLPVDQLVPEIVPTYNYSPDNAGGEPQSVSGLAITGFVISLISILCCGLTAVIGLIFSIAGLVVTSKKKKRGLGFAISGVVISSFLTLFFVLFAVFFGIGFAEAYKESDTDDFDEFISILEDELNETDEDEISDLSVSSDWNDYEVSEDFDQVTITYTDGIPDDFEFYDADFDDICDALEEDLVVTDSFGSEHRFDREAFRKVVSMVLISPDEYDRLDLSRDEVVSTLSYLATVSFEMSGDGFIPDRAVYTESSNIYDFYGIIEPNNLGRAVIVFTDGSRSVSFDDAMCGDEICWQMDPSDPDIFRLGLTADTLEEYPAGGSYECTQMCISILDDVI